MLSARLIHLIETHAASLTRGALQDVLTNERTASFRKVPRGELEPRINAMYQNLSKWIGNPDQDAIRREYEDWGRTRFHQGIPLSEIVCCVIVTKHHLRQFIHEHGLVTFSGDRVKGDEPVPVELYGIQELNARVGEFFDRVVYHLVHGYEMAAKMAQAAA
jgi:hypothetical protein